MDRWYWDTSAVLKLYCPESDSESYIVHFSNVEGLFLSSQLLEIELFYAIQQKRHGDEISEEEAEDAFKQFLSDKEDGHFELVPLSPPIVEAARGLWAVCEEEPQLTLRSLDGIHLATALNARSHHLVSADKRMLKIAERLGIDVPDLCYQ